MLFVYIFPQQLRGHLETLDELRQQVTPTDISAFDQLTEPVRVEILAAVEDYRTFTISMDYVGNGIMENGDLGIGERDEEEEVKRQTQGQWMMVANRNADHYQSLEDLRNVRPGIIRGGIFPSPENGFFPFLKVISMF